jgi:serine/threonine protein kinase, bacterial
MDSPAKPTRAALGGRFWLEEQLGEDASGELHRGIDFRNGTAVGVRIVRGIGAARRDRVLRDAKRAAQVQHPGLAVVRGVGPTEEGDIFVAAETLSGDRLSDRLRTKERFDPWEAAEIVTQVAHALAAAHAADVVHRELRPSLVVLGYEGDRTIVKVEGLGVPRPPAASDTDPELPYSAPEQRRGEPVGRRADVYSIGAMLAAMLTGQAPAPGDPAIDSPLGAVAARCLAEDPKDRYLDTNALREAIDAAVAALPPRVRSRMPMPESLAPAQAEVIPVSARVPSVPDVTEAPADAPEQPSDEPSDPRSASEPGDVGTPSPVGTTPPPEPEAPPSERPASTAALRAPERPARAVRSEEVVPPESQWQGPMPRVAVVITVMFVVARLLTSTVGAVVTSIAAGVAFYVAWTRARAARPPGDR